MWFVHFDFEICFAPQRRALFRHLNLQKWSVHGVLCTFWLRNVLRATTACTFSTSQLPKVVRHWCAFYILTSTCASRHNGVHFFDISTSKTAPNPSVFHTCYFQMCFAPQRRALFQHLNFQKWSGAEVFCTFSLRNRLRAATACNFSSPISPDVSAPAALASLLFNPPEPQNHEKRQCFATFLPFRAPASSFFRSFLSWLFSLLTAFSSLHIAGSLTSKLPSIKEKTHQGERRGLIFNNKKMKQNSPQADIRPDIKKATNQADSEKQTITCGINTAKLVLQHDVQTSWHRCSGTCFLLPPTAPRAPAAPASYCTYGTCCLLLHLRHLLHLSPTAPAALAPYCACGTCLLQHLDHMLRLPHQLKAGGWADCFLFFVFPISYNVSSSCCWSLLLSAQRQQRKQPTLANNASESASSTPRAPAARASYCTYGTCCTCLLLHLRHLLHLPPTPPTAPAFYSSRIKCDNLARPQRLNMRIAKLATSTVNRVLCCRICKR